MTRIQNHMTKIVRILVFAFLMLIPVCGVAQDKIKIACIGNSITEGVDNYPTPLARMLGDQYEVGNFGKWGHTLLRKGDHPYMSTDAFINAQKFQPNVVTCYVWDNVHLNKSGSLILAEHIYKAITGKKAPKLENAFAN